MEDWQNTLGMAKEEEKEKKSPQHLDDFEGSKVSFFSIREDAHKKSFFSGRTTKREGGGKTPETTKKKKKK